MLCIDVGRARVGVRSPHVVPRNPHPGPPHVMGEALRRRDGEGEVSQNIIGDWK